MNNQDWQQVESIFHIAISLSGKQRVLYLSEVCSGNNLLFSEVNSLISAFEQESQFLDQPAFSLGLLALEHNQEKSLAGQTISCYQIKEKLGGGGMGDVYLSEDMRLNRKVALKFLKNTLLDDRWAKRQFIREAQAVALLEHPNICAVHSIEETDEHNFIVMQYIEGQTLSDFINSRQLNVNEILSITYQLVSALALAHSHNIIHRDIKPGNIIITPDEQVKVLDFGLAKIIQQKQKTDQEAANTSYISHNGLILGTVSYMSPEQLRAEKLDYRSDIFSVGIVYEMLCKKNPFNRKSQAEIIAAILGDDPTPLKTFAPQVPNNFVSIVQKCLNKDKEKRFQSAAELLLEVESVKDGIRTNSAKPQSAGVYRFAALFFLFLVIVGTTIFFYQRSNKVPVLAVLPIANESGQADNDYLSVALTGNLISKFSRLSKLKVIAQPLISKYEKQQINPQIAGNELNADAVLVGKIISRENALILEISMINMADGNTMLQNQYLLDGEQLIFAQENISSAIIAKLVPTLTAEEKNMVTRHQTDSPDAQKFYFLGRYFWSQQHGKNMEKAIEYFTKAKEQDPYFAQAWSGLADAYAFYSVPSVDNPIPPVEAVQLSRAAAKNALDIDPGLCEPYTSMGMLELRYGWNWQEAENNFKKSLNLNPEYAPAHFGYSLLLIITGRLEEALIEGNKAKEYNPFDYYTELNLARIFYYRRDFNRAEQIYSELIPKYPENIRIKYGLGLSYLKMGRLKEATSIFEEIAKTNKPLALAVLGYTYARTDRKAEALQILSEIEQLSLSKDKFISSQEKAIVYLGLNNREQAFENLDKACDERFSAFPALLVDPLLDEFQSDPRFAAIKRCANLSP